MTDPKPWTPAEVREAEARLLQRRLAQPASSYYGPAGIALDAARDELAATTTDLARALATIRAQETLLESQARSLHALREQIPEIRRGEFQRIERERDAAQARVVVLEAAQLQATREAVGYALEIDRSVTRKAALAAVLAILDKYLPPAPAPEGATDG